MKIAFVGCGFVFDIYMRTLWAYPELEIRGVFDINPERCSVVSRHYGFYVYPNYEALLDDEAVELVVNLTSIDSHYKVIKQALEYGKHVYSEKPLTKNLRQSAQLFKIAHEKKCILTCAPCNLFSDSIATVFKAIQDGIIGKPVLVYAELDDNPVHLMELSKVQSPTGAPFPVAEELQNGCTVEHLAYHLVWICALFGPVQSVTAFSKCLVKNKTGTTLDPYDTPDFSVACLEFSQGAAARITCSWVAPRDHQFRIIGEKGEIHVDNIFHDQSPVNIERFSRVSLTARKSYTIRTTPLLGRLFNLGGQRIKLLRQWKSFGVECEKGVGRSLKHRLVSWFRRREVYAQDKMLGIAEMVRAIVLGKPQPLSVEFLMHLNELTLLIHGAGPAGVAVTPKTSFKPLDLHVLQSSSQNYLLEYRVRLIERIMSGFITALHK